MAMSTTGLQSSRLFFIKERVTGMHFLVDTGAEVSVIPRSFTAGTPQSSPQPGLTLQAVNHSPIMTFGNCSITLNIGLRRSFRWMFVIADVKHAILSSSLQPLGGCQTQCLNRHPHTPAGTWFTDSGSISQPQSTRRSSSGCVCNHSG